MGAGRSVAAGKRWGSKHLKGSLGQKANTEVTAAPTEPCPHTPAPSYKGPRPKQGVQVVEVSWPSHTCCHGCCCPHSVVQALVSPPSLPLPPHPPELGVEGALQTSPPFTEPWLCCKQYPWSGHYPHFKGERALTQRFQGLSEVTQLLGTRAGRGLPRRCCSKEPACQCRRCKRCGFNHWVKKIPWGRAWQPTPVFMPG